MLSTAAFNALLKTLEEPPPHVKFIFATTEAQKVPATITSRCQRFDLRRIPAELIAEHLLHIATQEKVVLEPEAAAVVAKGADGGLRDAESMLDQLVAFCGEKITADDVLTVFGFTSQETVQALTAHIFAQDASSALAVVAEQSAAGKDLSRLVADMIVQLRDLLVRSVQAAAGAPPVPREKLLTLLEHFAEAESRLRWATDKRLYFDVAVIKAIHLVGEASLTDVIDTLVAIGGGGELPVQPKPAPAPVRAAAPAPEPPKPQPIKFEIPRPEPEPAPKVQPPAPSPAPRAEEKMIISESSEQEAAAPEPVAVTQGIDGIWREVAETLAAESPIKFGWVVRGESAGLADGRLRVIFPASDHHQAESLSWELLHRHAEKELTDKFGSKTVLLCEFTADALPEPEPEPMEDASSAAPEPVVEPPKDPLEDFKNDPLIRKALEIFKAQHIPTT
jgi:DNA polymerase-3 subunit gamma/tau